MNLNKLCNLFFQHITTVKLYHFQTNRYAAHKAVDDYLSTFMGDMDTFMETAQGIYGKLHTNKNQTVKVLSLNDESFVLYLLDFSQKMMDIAVDNAVDLMNIRDDILGKLHKLIYLLTFK